MSKANAIHNFEQKLQQKKQSQLRHCDCAPLHQGEQKIDSNKDQ